MPFKKVSLASFEGGDVTGQQVVLYRNSAAGHTIDEATDQAMQSANVTLPALEHDAERGVRVTQEEIEKMNKLGGEEYLHMRAVTARRDGGRATKTIEDCISPKQTLAHIINHNETVMRASAAILGSGSKDVRGFFREAQASYRALRAEIRKEKAPAIAITQAMHYGSHTTLPSSIAETIAPPYHGGRGGRLHELTHRIAMLHMIEITSLSSLKGHLLNYVADPKHLTMDVLRTVLEDYELPPDEDDDEDDYSLPSLSQYSHRYASSEEDEVDDEPSGGCVAALNAIPSLSRAVSPGRAHSPASNDGGGKSRAARVETLDTVRESDQSDQRSPPGNQAPMPYWTRSSKAMPAVQIGVKRSRSDESMSGYDEAVQGGMVNSPDKAQGSNLAKRIKSITSPFKKSKVFHFARDPGSSEGAAQLGDAEGELDEQAGGKHEEDNDADLLNKDQVRLRGNGQSAALVELDDEDTIT